MAGGYRRGPVVEADHYHKKDVRDIAITELRRQIQQLQDQLNQQQQTKGKRSHQSWANHEGINEEEDNSFYPRQHSRTPLDRQPKPVFDSKIDIPEFEGESQPEEFLDWVHTVERVFKLKGVPEGRRVKLAALKLKKYAGLWWENLRRQRVKEGKSHIRSWDKMKKKLKKQFLPNNYKQDFYVRQPNLIAEDYTTKCEHLIIKYDIGEHEEQTVARPKVEDKRRKLVINAEKAKLPSVSKGDVSFDHSISHIDSINHLSSIKLARSRYQVVKNLKFPGDGIQRKSLIHVLDDVNSFHIQSYDKFEAEEEKKLHEHWLLIVMEDIPKASMVYKENKLQREDGLNSLGIELIGKRKLILNKDEKLENLEILPQEFTYSTAYFDQHKQALDVQDDKDVKLKYNIIDDNLLKHTPSISTGQEIVCTTINDYGDKQGPVGRFRLVDLQIPALLESVSEIPPHQNGETDQSTLHEESQQLTGQLVDGDTLSYMKFFQGQPNNTRSASSVKAGNNSEQQTESKEICDDEEESLKNLVNSYSVSESTIEIGKLLLEGKNALTATHMHQKHEMFENNLVSGNTRRKERDKFRQYIPIQEALPDCLLTVEIDPCFLRAQLRAENCHLAFGGTKKVLKNFENCLSKANHCNSNHKIFLEASDGLLKTQQAADYMVQYEELVLKGLLNEATDALQLVSKTLFLCPYSNKLTGRKAEVLLWLQHYNEIIPFCEQSTEIPKRNCGINMKNFEDMHVTLGIPCLKEISMATLSKSNCRNMYISRARQRLSLSENASREALLAPVKAAYEWAKGDYIKVRSYEEALRIKAKFFDGRPALALQKFEEAKLSWYYLIGSKADLDKWPSSNVVTLFNQVEDSIEKETDMWEGMEESWLMELSKPNGKKALLQKMGLVYYFIDFLTEDVELASNMTYQMNIKWKNPKDLGEVLAKCEARPESKSVVSKSEGVEFTIKIGFLCPALSKAVKTMKRVAIVEFFEAAKQSIGGNGTLLNEIEEEFSPNEIIGAYEIEVAELQADINANMSTNKPPPMCMLRQAANAYTPTAYKMFERGFDLLMECILYSCDNVGTISEYHVTVEEKQKKFWSDDMEFVAVRGKHSIIMANDTLYLYRVFKYISIHIC